MKAKNNSMYKSIRSKYWLLLVLINMYLLTAETTTAQKTTSKGAFYTGTYTNFFKQAGYSQADINAKVNKAYYDLFEGPNKVYFEVGDSMAYVSDLKNHEGI